jgi:hypothetical protein
MRKAMTDLTAFTVGGDEFGTCSMLIPQVVTKLVFIYCSTSLYAMFRTVKLDTYFGEVAICIHWSIASQRTIQLGEQPFSFQSALVKSGPDRMKGRSLW